jgi:molecular chaperone DnaJ
MKHHPDRNPGDKGRGEIQGGQRGLRILSDASKRAAYDQYGHAGRSQMGGGAVLASAARTSPTSSAMSSATSSVAAAWRQWSRRPAARRDLRYTLDLDLEEAVRGTTVTIRVPTLVNCKPARQRCQARYVAGDLPDLWRYRPGAHAAGLLLGAADLPALPWQRQDHHRSVWQLPRRRRVEEYKTLSVKVPAGVDTGDRIRLSGEGEAGRMAVRPATCMW